MLKIGFIILAHQKPKQLSKLISVIQSESTFFFLHIDKRADKQSFLNEDRIRDCKNLFFLPRFKSYWGGIGLVKATLEGLKEAVRNNCDYALLLSGSDYPIKSNKEIIEFLNTHKGFSFVDYYKMPASYWLPGKEINRIKKYYFHLNNKLFEYPMSSDTPGILRKSVNFILSFFLKKERTFPKDIIPYGGDQWFCITKEACQEVLDFYLHHPEVLAFLEHTLIPDEIFIQTALFNSGNKNLINKIIGHSLTHINWESKNNPSPVLFNTSDFSILAQSDKLFARKFEMDQSPELINLIDQQLLGLGKNSC